MNLPVIVHKAGKNRLVQFIYGDIYFLTAEDFCGTIKRFLTPLRQMSYIWNGSLGSDYRCEVLTMKEAISLDTLAVDEWMEIAAVGHGCKMKERLRDLGFDEGTRVCCLGAAPLGDPRAYLIRGSVIALRAADARWIIGFGGCDGAR